MSLTRYEAAKIVGIRSLKLSEGEVRKVNIPSGKLCTDFLFVAALELRLGLLDVCVQRGDTVWHVSDLEMPSELENLLELRGGPVYNQLLLSAASSSSVSSLDSRKSSL